MARYFLDTEFDGHRGALLSMALVSECGRSIHIRTTARADDPWVKENVEPHMGKHFAQTWNDDVPTFSVGAVLRQFIGDDPAPVIIADSPVDIGRFCVAISTGKDGRWETTEYERMTFEVHNVDCYPTEVHGAIQHNAWWDAVALMTKISHAR